MHHHHDRMIKTLLILCILISLACRMPFVKNSKPSVTIPVSTEAVEKLKSNVESAFEQSQKSGQVSIVITESQITSLVTYELQSSTEPQVSGLQIYLRDGQIQIYFTLLQNGLSLPGQCLVNVQTDGKGGFNIDILSAKIGPLPLTNEMKKMLSEEIKKAIGNQIYTNYGNLYIDSISISDSEMLILGHIQ